MDYYDFFIFRDNMGQVFAISPPEAEAMGMSGWPGRALVFQLDETTLNATLCRLPTNNGNRTWRAEQLPFHTYVEFVESLRANNVRYWAFINGSEIRLGDINIPALLPYGQHRHESG